MIYNIKYVKGYENLYAITWCGDVFSLKTNKKLKTGSRRGYKSVCLYKDGIAKYFSVHRLVAHAFLSNSENKNQVNHIDGNKLNNIASNLEWCTGSENMKHCFKIGLQSNRGENHSRTNFTNDDIFNIRKLSSKHSQSEIAKMFNVGQSCVSRIINGVRWSHVEV